MATDGFEWDPAKATANLRKHGVDFADAATALEDPLCLTMTDPDSNGEERSISIGKDGSGRILVTVITYRGTAIRRISSRPATPGERRRYQDK
jgi:uncharacterized DUF497 family protein